MNLAWMANNDENDKIYKIEKSIRCAFSIA